MMASYCCTAIIICLVAAPVVAVDCCRQQTRPAGRLQTGPGSPGSRPPLGGGSSKGRIILLLL